MIEELTADMRELLSHRSVRNKIGVPVDRDILPVALLPALFELQRLGYLVWIDRGTANVARRPGGPPLMCDVYLLTPEGIELCERHGILPK